MNILLYVMTFLMILSILTYAKLDTFRNTIALQNLYRTSLTMVQKDQLSFGQTTWYESSHIEKEGEQKTKEEKQIKSRYTSRLSLHSFFDPKERETASPVKLQTALFLKKLLFYLYGGKPVLEAAERDHPGIIESLVNALFTAGTKVPKNFKISTINELGNLNLENPVAQKLLYEMLKGNPTLFETSFMPDETAEIQPGEKSSEGDVPQKEDTDYPVLGDYLTLTKSSGIRVYLASKPLLAVLFGDLGTADAIILARKDLYNQVDKGRDAAEASAEFKNFFLEKRDPSIDPSFLDFSVSKTNPSRYD